MKIMMLFVVGILLINSPVFAELSITDIEKIESIVKGSEARMKEYVSQEIAKINTKIDEMDKRLTSQINAVDTQVGRNFNLVLGLIALIAVAIGLPQIITAWQGRNSENTPKNTRHCGKEIEILKQERTVRS